MSNECTRALEGGGCPDLKILSFKWGLENQQGKEGKSRMRN